jgi:hypothetical protein
LYGSTIYAFPDRQERHRTLKDVQCCSGAEVGLDCHRHLVARAKKKRFVPCWMDDDDDDDALLFFGAPATSEGPKETLEV